MKQLGPQFLLASVLLAPPSASQAGTDEAARPEEVRASPEEAAEARTRRAISAEEALETFTFAWRLVHETHFDEEFNGVDWVGLREAMLPRVREVQVSSVERRLQSSRLHVFLL